MIQDAFTVGTLKEAKLAVVGSLNTDHVWTLDELPKPGQTLMATDLRLHWGGKGANQAVAAARFGVQVSILSMVGDDGNGRRYAEHLKEEGVRTDGIHIFEGLPSGVAYIYVDKRGENMIVVDPGATGKLSAKVVAKYLPSILEEVSTVLLPLELPLDAALETLRLAERHGVRSVLNASPVCSDFPWGKYPVDTVIVNKHECAEFFGKTPADLASSCSKERIAALRERKVNHLVVTQGAEPTIMLSESETIFVKTRQVRPLDTVGAGDTFAGVLAAQLAVGNPNWSEIISVAGMAATLSTLKIGAQSAMPYHEEIMRALSQNGVLREEDVRG